MVTREFDGAGVVAVTRARGRGRASVADRAGTWRLAADTGDEYRPAFSILTASSVLFDAVYVAGGEHAMEWLAEADAVEFVKDAFKHCKPVAAPGEGLELLEEAEIGTGLRDAERGAS